MKFLSDRGANFLSALMMDVCKLTGIEKLNTTAYHPRGNGLVENFNKSIRSMIAKHAQTHGPNWDLYLQHLLFAYRTKPHGSTNESPFYLLYGRDARLPTETVLSPTRIAYSVDLDDYKIELTRGLSTAWKIAQNSIAAAQKKQKKQFDQKAKDVKYVPGDRVMVYMPHEDTGKLRKLALPHHGPYRVLEVLPNGLSLRPVDRPEEQPILVNRDRVTKCPTELPDVSWLGKKKRKSQKNDEQKTTTKPSPQQTRYELRKRQ